MYRRTNEEGALEMLAGLTTEQLLAGLAKGRRDVGFVKALHDGELEDAHGDIGHPGRHPSKSYEVWAQNDVDRRICVLETAIRDVIGELDRRRVPFPGPRI